MVTHQIHSAACDTVWVHHSTEHHRSCLRNVRAVVSLGRESNPYFKSDWTIEAFDQTMMLYVSLTENSRRPSSAWGQDTAVCEPTSRGSARQILQTCHCGNDDQTPEHVLQACPFFDDQRKDVWPVETDLETKLWGTADNHHLTTPFTTPVGLQVWLRPVERKRRRRRSPTVKAVLLLYRLCTTTGVVAYDAHVSRSGCRNFFIFLFVYCLSHPL